MKISDLLEYCHKDQYVWVDFVYANQMYVGRLDDDDFRSKLDDVDDYMVKAVSAKHDRLHDYLYIEGY